MSKPEPLVPVEVDISGMDGFLLNVQQLFASELWALSTGDEFKAAVALWGRAWLQVPAGSLPNDERVLAAFSGAGARWKKVRAIALRGFVECSDGRLYHKVLCGDVMTAWEKRVAFRKRTEAATIARRQRNDQRNDDVTESQIQLQITVTEDSKKEIESIPRAVRARPLRFEEFYRAYPKHVDRKAAAKKYETVVKSGISEDKLIDAAGCYSVHCRSKSVDPDFIKSPLVWLNKGCWDDELSGSGQSAAVLPFDRPTPKTDDELREIARRVWAESEAK